MLTEENAGLYAVTPSCLLFDKDLSLEERCFFSIIENYADGSARLEADIFYFADLLEKEENVIRQWLDHLAERKYIAVSKGRIRILPKGLVF